MYTLDEAIDATNTVLDRNQQELVAKQKQLEQVEQRAAESQKRLRDLDAMRNKIGLGNWKMRRVH